MSWSMPLRMPKNFARLGATAGCPLTCRSITRMCEAPEKDLFRSCKIAGAAQRFAARLKSIRH